MLRHKLKRDIMEMILYALAIGSIMYMMLCTRQNRSYALSITSRYQSNISKGHKILF